MVSAYTAFPNKGIRVAPLFVTRIEDNDGNVLATFSPEMQEVISASSAYKMLVMLRAVVNEGTGPVAGWAAKTVIFTSIRCCTDKALPWHCLSGLNIW